MGRVREIDAVRGLAALVIMFAHIGILPGTPWVLSGVDLFFVISGYLITTSILANQAAPRFLAVFFVRRALRIWPAYYVAFAACLVLNRGLVWDQPCDAWPQYLTFTQNVQAYFLYPSRRFSGMFLHTWTLAIEEQFYLLWPLLMFRAGRKGMYAIALTFVALPAVARSQGSWPLLLLLTRSDGLALGSLLALLLADRGRPESRVLAYRAGFAAVGLLALTAPFLVPPVASDRIATALFTTRAALVYFGLTGLILCTQGHPWLAVLRDRRLCYMGTVSYALYLYHPLVFGAFPSLYKRYVVRKLGLTSPLLMDLVMLGVCFLLAEASRRWLEAPILALKDRIKFTTVGSSTTDRGATAGVTVHRDPGHDLAARGTHTNPGHPAESQDHTASDFDRIVGGAPPTP